MLESLRHARAVSRVRGITSAYVLVAVAAASCLFLAPSGNAAPGAPGFPQIAPTKDANGHGAWFRRVCTSPGPQSAGCEASVVSSDVGAPLQSPTPPSSAKTPAQLHSAYSLPTTSSSGTPTIGIVDAYGDPNIVGDLTTFDSNFGLPAPPSFTVVNETGGTTLPNGNSWHLEIALDVETAHAICQNCNIVLVEASSNSFADLGAAENEAVAQGANVISNSWGGSEGSSETSLDSYFTHSGVAITASTGDGGYGTLYPAASPDVIAAGGTSLYLNNDGSYHSETAWSGGGSGCSGFEPAPSWQPSIGCSKRMIADISADADPNTGVAVYDSVGTAANDAWYQVGGTSLSSPIIASTYALTGTTQVDNASGLYANANYSTNLHDVTTGSNGSCSTSLFCSAGTGYDGPTGLGTPDGLGAFEPGPPPPPAADFSLSAAPSTVALTPGGSVPATITVNPSSGFGGSVSLAASGLPTGVTASFSPSSTTGSSTLTLNASSAAPGTTATVTVTGTSGALKHTTTLTVQVRGFTLSASPTSQTVSSGTTASYKITVNPAGGFTGPVALSASGQPSGSAVAFSPSSPTSSSTLTVPTSASGTFTIAVTGTSGTLSSTVRVTLTVRSTKHGR
jgi:subtilase family serine protease